MTEVVENKAYVKMDPEKALSKWKPILEVLNVTDDDMKKIMANYAEHDGTIEIGKKTLESKLAYNLLPISLKVLSQLNLKGKEVIFTDAIYWQNKNRTDLIDKMLDEVNPVNEQKKQIKVHIDSDFLYSMGVEKAVQHFESVLMNQLVIQVNEELEKGTTLYLTRMIDSLDIEPNSYGPNAMVLTSYYSVE